MIDYSDLSVALRSIYINKNSNLPLYAIIFETFKENLQFTSVKLNSITGISENTLSDILNGKKKSLSLKTVAKICITLPPTLEESILFATICGYPLYVADGNIALKQLRTLLDQRYQKFHPRTLNDYISILQWAEQLCKENNYKLKI